uniref:Lysophospholipid acyltransferase 5 n=1 Tax=Ditylenchus dipsaci TaxID=166011 RepID=A0A915CVU8_9BILA
MSKNGLEMGVVGFISDLVSVREDGLRLLISILAGYPLAAIYRSFIYNKRPAIQHYFFIAVGVLLYIFNCGVAIYHSLFNLSVVLAHVGFMGHLLMGYWFAESARYDITWTTPFCIMTLRYIGLVMDVYDGKQNEKNLKSDQLKTAIKDPPSLVETAAFGLFFSGTLVGPQFTLSRFRSFVNGEFLDEKREVRSSSIMASIQRFVAGVSLLGLYGFLTHSLHRLSSITCPFLENYLEYLMVPSNYVSILHGFSSNGGICYSHRWDGTRDLNIIKWELGSDFQSVVESFNCGTNTFAKNHIFRRLKWLGNKYYSQAITLSYLAIWHGFHLGYFMLFFYEFTCMWAQGQLFALIKRTEGAEEFFKQSWTRPFTWLFGRITINISMAFGFLTFGLIKKEIWIVALKAMYFYGYIIYFVVLPASFALLWNVLPRKKSLKPKAT